jgi:Fur family ferric uptake transcriptional regulator
MIKDHSWGIHVVGSIMIKDVNLKKVGLKTTIPRLKVLQVLNTVGKRHVSAEEIYKYLIEKDEEISLATIYRVLTQFEEAKLVKRHYFEGGYSVFELNKGLHHDHMVCFQCNTVIEFVDDEIEKRQDMIAKKNNFKMVDHSLTIYGFCQLCISRIQE